MRYSDFSRRRWLQAASIIAAQSSVACSGTADLPQKYSVSVLRGVALTHGYSLSDERLEAIRPGVERNLAQLEAVRRFRLDESVEPAAIFIAKF